MKWKNHIFPTTLTQRLTSGGKSRICPRQKIINNNQLNSIKITVDDSDASIYYANALAEQWKENLGLTVTVEALSYSDRVTKIQSNGYQILINYWDIPYPSLENVLKLFDSHNNFSNYDNDEFHEKLSNIYSTSNQANKNTLIEEAFALLKNDVPVAPLYYRNKSFVSTGRVRDIITDSYRDIDLYFAYVLER